MKKLLALTLVLALCLSIAACTQGEVSGDTPGQPTQESTEGAAVTQQITDFDGYDFVVADWYSAEETGVFSTSWEEFVYNHRKDVEAQYNLTYTRKNIALTGNYTELVPAKLMAKDKDVSMYYFFEGYVVPTVSQNLLWDLRELSSFDENDPKWDKISMNTFTFGDSIYAVDYATREPLMGMFYNKRILEEAGLDPDLPYDLQKNGQWTWSKFEELCQLTTKDTDKDGITDTWGVGSTYGNLSLFAAWSNNAAFVTRDENGKFVDGTTDPAFLEAMEWLQNLASKGWLYVYRTGGAGEDALQAFQNGQIAFLPYNFWLTEEPTLTQSKDEWGWVYLPYGPSAEGLTMCAQSYGYGIPKNFTKEEAEMIFQAFDKLTDITVDGASNDWTVDGAEEYQDTFWMEVIGNSVQDSRAVEETLYDMMFNSDKVMLDAVRMVPGFNYTNFASDLINLRKTPMEKIEEMRPANVAAINGANALLGLE